jgi:hypothetical protein
MVVDLLTTVRRVKSGENRGARSVFPGTARLPRRIASVERRRPRTGEASTRRRTSVQSRSPSSTLGRTKSAPLLRCLAQVHPWPLPPAALCSERLMAIVAGSALLTPGIGTSELKLGLHRVEGRGDTCANLISTPGRPSQRSLPVEAHHVRPPPCLDRGPQFKTT